MIKHILKQLWNRRRANGWVFVELILVTFFMWNVLDPVYVLLSNRAIPPGYDIDNTFRMTIDQYDSNHGLYEKENDTDSVRKLCFMRIYDMIRQYPGVESSVIVTGHQYPLSSSSSSWSLRYDSLESSVLQMAFYDDGEFFKVFRIHDANTGKIPDHRGHTTHTIYVTENVAKKIYPGGDIVGKETYNVYGVDSTALTVAAMMDNYKFRSTEQPYPTLFMPLRLEDIEFKNTWSAQFCFRIRDGISPQVFMEEFKKEMKPRFNLGNLYLKELTSFDTILRNSEVMNGVTNTMRLHSALAIFFLICTFLGIAGNFWLQSNSRRDEIGLRMAMGSTRNQILKEFLTESWLISTLAWFIGVILVLQQVYFIGFAEPSRFPDPSYIQNQFIPHFLIVSLIVYILILIISFVGTWIPASRAAKIQPAEALRDE